MKFGAECINKLIRREKVTRVTHQGRYNTRRKRFVETNKYKMINFKHDTCHDPNCNLLITCDLNRVLNDYMPYYDVLKDFIISYIGYDCIYYVNIYANNVEWIIKILMILKIMDPLKIF